MRETLKTNSLERAEDMLEKAKGSTLPTFLVIITVRDWNIDRVQCLELITEAGLEIPPNGAYCFRADTKKSGVVHPHDCDTVLFCRALPMARVSQYWLDTVAGFGRSFAWESL